MVYNTQSDFELLVLDRLDYLASRVRMLKAIGNYELARFLTQEGHDLIAEYESGQLFWVGQANADSH
jgi:hypothetical protein